ncbi:MAG: aldo/keto reductase [Methanotrichaceae archaeon]|nr:aldo/keto reductase [Methanotrichaceae archaeon]
MRYKLFGKSGLRVSELCLGTMTFGEEWGWGGSKEESKKIFDAYAEAGDNFIDTANHYTNGTSEKYLGEFIGSDRENFVIATKYTLNGRPKDPNGGGNHRKSMMQSLNAILERLGTNYIDIYWVHAWDFLTPVEEVMRALDDVVRAGKVLYIGISDAPAWVVSRANTMAELRGWTPFTGTQVQYSLIERTPERDLLPMAKSLDIAITAWSPLGAGLLTGKYAAKSGKGPEDARLSKTDWGSSIITEKNLTIVEEVKKIALETGRTPAQVALNWLRKRKSGVIIPIIGAKKHSQVKDNLGCLEFELREDQLKRLGNVSKIDLGFPHDFLNMDFTKWLIYGDSLNLIDNHRANG